MRPSPRPPQRRHLTPRGIACRLVRLTLLSLGPTLLGLTSFGLAFATGTASAGVTPLGEPAVINTRFPCEVSRPRIARLPGGETLVAWRGEEGTGIALRRLDPNGQPLGDRETLLPAPRPVGPHDLAADAVGRAVVVWTDTQGRDVLAQRLGPDGVPLGEVIEVEQGSGGISGVAVDASPGGGFVAVWTLDTGVWARRYDGEGVPVGPRFNIIVLVQPLCPGCSVEAGAPAVTVDAAGGFLAAWEIRSVFGETVDSTVAVRRYDTQDQPAGEPEILGDAGSGREPAVGVDAAGRGVVVWRTAPTLPGADPELLARLLDAQGEPRGDSVHPLGGPPPAGPPDVTVFPDGRFLVVAPSEEREPFRSVIFGRLVDAEASSVSPIFELEASTDDFEALPAVAAAGPLPGGAGRAVVVWERFPPFPPILPPDCPQPRTILARVVSFDCAPGPRRLCLGDGRFAVEVTWEVPTAGVSGPAQAVPVTADTGAFWFFEPDNLELMIKVLDGTPVNGHFWVFYGALSNVGYTVTVTDTLQGTQRTYANPPGRLASLADVTAFALPPAPAPQSARTAAGTLPAAGCTGDASALCLLEGRFRVSVLWRDPRSGNAGEGMAVALRRETGAFWFFAPDNLELMVKVLDGTAVNGHFWVFYGALSEVEYDLTVEDLESGARRTYHNPARRLASRADVTFPREPCVCPPVIDPVCGTDGQTYASPCDAELCAGVTVAHPGECSPASPALP